MAAIPTSVVDPVADAIYAHYKRVHGAEPQRGYLGASAIGKPCTRALWYGWHWALQPTFDGRMYRLFQSGHLQEPRVNADLRAIGCTVYEVNPETGQQWSFVELTSGGHFRGNCDGILTGLPQAPKAPTVVEIKTASDKAFQSVKKNGVMEEKPEHYAQMQIYMKWTQDLYKSNGCKRALYIVVNKNTDEIYTERLDFDATFAKSIIAKAIAIIESNEPPIGISQDQSWYECRFCDYHSLCFGTTVPEATCRSCAHSTPEMDGDARWSCAKHQADNIPMDIQRAGCAGHRFIPILLQRVGTPVDEVDGCITYETANGTFVNGNPEIDPTHISSAEIHACEDKRALTHSAIAEMRKKYEGRIVS